MALIADSYRSLRKDLTVLPAGQLRVRIFRALCALETRAARRHRDGDVEQLPYDLSYEGP